MCGGHEVAAGAGPAERAAARGEKTQLGQPGALDQAESQRHRHRRFDAGAIDLTVALRGVAVAAREQCAVHEYGQIEMRPWREMADVDVAAVLAWRDGREPSVLARRDTHHAAEGL